MAPISSTRLTAQQFIRTFEQDPKAGASVNFAKFLRKGIEWSVILITPLCEIPMEGYKLAKKCIHWFRPESSATLVTPESLDAFHPTLEPEKILRLKENLTALFALKDKIAHGANLSFFYDESATVCSVSLQGHIALDPSFAEITKEEAEFVFAHELSHFHHKDILKTLALKTFSIAIPISAFFGHSFLAYYVSYAALHNMNYILSRHCVRRADQDAIKLLNSNLGAILTFYRNSHELAVVALVIDKKHQSRFEKLNFSGKIEVIKYLSKNGICPEDPTHPATWERLKSAEAYRPAAKQD